MTKNQTDLSDILAEIIQTYGLDILKEHRRVYALLNDLAPGELFRKQRRRIFMALQSGAVSILMRALDDKAGYEIYLNEAIMRLISETDMADKLAIETMRMIAKGLGLQDDDSSKPVAPKQKSEPHISTQNDKHHLKWKKMFGVLAVIGIVLLMFMGQLELRPYMIGLCAGAAVSAVSLAIAYVLQNHLLFNEMCQTFSIVIPIVFMGNLLIRMLTASEYPAVYQILNGFVLAGSLANAVYTRIDLEEKWTWPNIVMALASLIMLFYWPEDVSWEFWQWVIGIGGGLLLTAIGFAVVEILHYAGIEQFITLSILMLLLSVVNLLLLYHFAESYLIIARCFLVMLALGSSGAMLLCYIEAASFFQFLNLLSTILNAGVFILLVLLPYEQLQTMIQSIIQSI